MNLFMQGMRRSGTTIVYDILFQDPRLDLNYEVFSAGKVGALGGGSEMLGHDLMQKTRRRREHFVAMYPESLTVEALNYGAPRDSELELQAELPEYCLDYLRFLMSQARHSVFKFTRMYRKVHHLHALDPESKMVILLRHPQAVVASYMYGKAQKRLPRFDTAEKFFESQTNLNPWNSRKMFEGILRQESRPDFESLPDWMRYLVLWRYTFEFADREARAAYGDGYHLLRHEELAERPREVVSELYRHMDLEPCREALDWAEQNVVLKRKEWYPENPRWREAYGRLGLEPILERAGYPPAV